MLPMLSAPPPPLRPKANRLCQPWLGQLSAVAVFGTAVQNHRQLQQHGHCDLLGSSLN